MINIRPVSDHHNRFIEKEETVKKGESVYLTKNRYGSMVLSLEQYAALTDDVEFALDEADKAADMDDTRNTANEVFGRIRRRLHE